MKDKILEWLVNGHVGVSSKAMACAAAGIPLERDPFGNHPYDPDDFNRCLLLIERVPEIKDHMDKIAGISEAWARLVENWDEIEKTFIEEVGLNWSKGRCASKTYELMKNVLA